MALLHSSHTSLPGKVLKRVYRSVTEQGVYFVAPFFRNQPDVHAAYRTYFSSVDNFNKVSLGPRSV